MVPHRRAEIPLDRVPVPQQQRVADHLVAERAADPGLRRVPDVVEVEQQERAAFRRPQSLLRPGEAVLAVSGSKSIEELLGMGDGQL